MVLDNTQKAIVLGMARNGMNISKTAREANYSWRGIMYNIEKMQRKFNLDARDFYDLCKLLEMIGEKLKND